MGNKNNLDTIIQLITMHSDWKSALEKRQHKFILSLIQHEYDLSNVAQQFHYAPADMLSIFSRIENQLVRFDKAKREAEEKKKLSEMLMELDSATRAVFESVLKESKKVNLHEVFPEKLAQYIETLMETKSIEESAKRFGVGKSYIISRIKGRNKPRKPCEKGALYYLHHTSISA